MPDDNSSMSRSPTSNDNLRIIGRETCLFPSLEIDCVLEFAAIGHQLLAFKLFWKFPIKGFPMELLSHQIHMCNSLRVLKSNTFGGGMLKSLVHQGQDGLLRLQSHPRTDQSLGFRALGSGAEAIAAAAAKWVLGIESKLAWLAPVTAHTSYMHLTGALPCLINTGALFSLRIAGPVISARQEALARAAVRVVPVTSTALSTFCTREFGMTVALACVYIALEIQGAHRAAVTSLTTSGDAVAPGIRCTFRTFLSNGIGGANALTSLGVTIIAQMGAITSCAASFLEVEITVSTAVTFLSCYSRLAPTLTTLFTVK